VTTGQQLRQGLIERLNASRRLTVTEKMDEAEVALKEAPTSAGTAAGPITLRLVSARGEVLWSTTQTGSATQIADQATKALLDEIQKLERREGLKKP
jgi:hypothetical protein